MIEYIERTLGDIENSPEDEVVTRFETLRQQGERMGDNLSLFANNREKHLMGEHAVDATRLQVFVDIIRDSSEFPEARQAAALQVMDYVTGPHSPSDAEDLQYMFALWCDLPKIDTVANSYRTRLEEANTDQSQLALDKLDGKIGIDEDDWHSIRIGVDVPEIVKLSQNVNVESILARSALVLDRVATAEVYDKEVLKDILEIETVYAPLLDLLGLHAYEATLRHHAEKARLLATGNEGIIQAYEDASSYVESVRASGLADRVMSDVVGIDFDRHDFSFIIDNEETAYGSKSYFSAIRYEGADGGIPARYISRIKSPGSYAHKRLFDEGYEKKIPQDVYAGTVVVKGIDEVVAIFKTIYGNIETHGDEYELVAAPSKNSPIHLRGKKAYLEKVTGLLGETFAGKIDVATVDDEVEEEFEVLRVTFNAPGGECEIQIQTEEARNRSRLGGASHLCFKSEGGNGLPGNIPGGSSDLWSVNLRKWAMLEGGENIYENADHDAKLRQNKEVGALQQLFIETAFETERLSNGT